MPIAAAPTASDPTSGASAAAVPVVPHSTAAASTHTLPEDAARLTRWSRPRCRPTAAPARGPGAADGSLPPGRPEPSRPRAGTTAVRPGRRRGPAGRPSSSARWAASSASTSSLCRRTSCRPGAPAGSSAAALSSPQPRNPWPVGHLGVIDVGLEDRADPLPGITCCNQSAPVEGQPLLVPRLQVREHQVVLRGEVVVEAHLRHTRSGRDGVDPGAVHPVVVEAFGCCGQQSVPGRTPHAGTTLLY